MVKQLTTIPESTGEIFGYARVSTKDQDTERQLIKLRKLVSDERYLFEEKESGKNFDRPQYQAMRLMFRKGDLLYLDALDRLGRDYDGIISEWKYLTREVGIDIAVLENSQFDSRVFRKMGSEFGKLMEDMFLTMLAYMAEQERKKNLRRQTEGYAVARAKGVKFGRKRKEIGDEFGKLVTEFHNGKITAVEIRKRLNMTKSTYYRRYKELVERGEAN